MKAKEKVQRYTQTQINMLVERMVKDGKQRLEKATSARDEKKTEAAKARISAALTSLSPAQRAVVLDALHFNNNRVRAAFKLPKCSEESGWHMRGRVERLGLDFKFKLTMASAADYEKHMAEFQAAVDKLLK